MAYLVLARKWRPQTFAHIAGQAHVTRTLQNAIRANRIAHAYLFTGVRGVGKTTAARILAKALNCELGPTPDPCNRCTNCQEITSGNSIDVLEIDGASNRGIDEIRQIIESVRYQPAKSRFKIYIVDEVHQVTKDAFNALLKTLEEPPPSVKFILATTEPQRLPETILSRCQRFDFRRIALREVVQRLNEIAAEEGLKITEGALVLLAREADGSMRDGQSLLEQVLACAGAESTDRQAIVDEQLLEDLLGLAPRRSLYLLSQAVIEGNARRCVEIISDAVVQGWDLCRLSKDLVEHFRNLLIARLTDRSSVKDDQRSAVAAEREKLLDLPDQEISDLEAQAAHLSVETLLDLFEFMAKGDDEVTRAANPRFALESVLVRLATLPKAIPIPQLLDRLEKLEKRLGDGKSVPARAVEVAPRDSKPSPETLVTAEESGVAKIWQDFVASVRNQKKLLATYLESGTPLEISPGLLKIGITDRHHLGYLQDPENLAVLKTFAREFFSNDVAVTIAQIAPAPASAAGAQERSGAAASAADRDMVKEALRIFGGTIKTLRREN